MPQDLAITHNIRPEYIQQNKSILVPVARDLTKVFNSHIKCIIVYKLSYLRNLAILLVVQLLKNQGEIILNDYKKNIPNKYNEHKGSLT